MLNCIQFCFQILASQYLLDEAFILKYNVLNYFQDTDSNVNGRQQTSDTDESEDEMPDMDLAAGNKDTWILEVIYIDIL